MSDLNTTNGTSLLAKIFNLVGTAIPTETTYLENQWKNYFLEGSRDIVKRSIPQNIELLKSLVTDFSTSAQTDKNEYVILDDSVQSVIDVRRNGYLCKEISNDIYKWYLDNDTNKGIYETSSFYPVYTVDNTTAGQSKILVLPSSATDVIVKKVDYTNIDAVDLRADNTINGVSSELSNLFILFSAIRILNDEIATQTSEITTQADALKTLGDSLSTIGDDILSTITTLTAGFSSYLGDSTFRDALDNAKALIDSKAKDHSSDNVVVTNDAFEWINDEDSEMVQAVMMVAQQEVSRAGTELTGQLESLKNTKEKVQGYQAKAQNIQAQIQSYQARLQVYTQKLSIYSARKQELQREYYGYFGQKAPEPKEQKESN